MAYKRWVIDNKNKMLRLNKFLHSKLHQGADNGILAMQAYTNWYLDQTDEWCSDLFLPQAKQEFERVLRRAEVDAEVNLRHYSVIRLSIDTFRLAMRGSRNEANPITCGKSILVHLADHQKEGLYE